MFLTEFAAIVHSLREIDLSKNLFAMDINALRAKESNLIQNRKKQSEIQSKLSQHIKIKFSQSGINSNRVNQNVVTLALKGKKKCTSKEQIMKSLSGFLHTLTRMDFSGL